MVLSAFGGPRAEGAYGRHSGAKCRPPKAESTMNDLTSEYHQSAAGPTLEETPEDGDKEKIEKCRPQEAESTTVADRTDACETESAKAHDAEGRNDAQTLEDALLDENEELRAHIRELKAQLAESIDQLTALEESSLSCSEGETVSCGDARAQNHHLHVAREHRPAHDREGPEHQLHDEAKGEHLGTRVRAEDHDEAKGGCSGRQARQDHEEPDADVGGQPSEGQSSCCRTTSSGGVSECGSKRGARTRDDIKH